MNKLTSKFLLFLLTLILIAGVILKFTVSQATWQQNINPRYFLEALLVLILGWLFDAGRILVLAQGIGKRISWARACQVVLSNYFLGAFTPASVGGLAGQIYFLRKANISTGKATALVLIRTLLSLIFLLVLFPLAIAQDFLALSFLQDTAWYLLAFFIFLVLITALVLFSPKRLEKVSLFFLNLPFIHHFLIKRKWWEPVNRAINDLIQSMNYYVGKSRKNLWLAFFYTGISLGLLFSSVFLIIGAFGFFPSFLKLLGRMVILNFCLYFAPTPGGTGLAEGGLMVLLKGLVPWDVLGLVAILWRCLAEYLPFFLGFLICLPTLGWQQIERLLQYKKE